MILFLWLLPDFCGERKRSFISYSNPAAPYGLASCYFVLTQSNQKSRLRLSATCQTICWLKQIKLALQAQTHLFFNVNCIGQVARLRAKAIYRIAATGWEAACSFEGGNPSGERDVKNWKCLSLQGEFFQFSHGASKGSTGKRGRKCLFGSFCGMGQKERKESLIPRSLLL